MPGWAQFVGLIENLLTQLHNGLGSWGLAIVLFTVAIKVVTWPLTSKQLKSSKVMQEMQPKLKALQEKYKDDKEKQTQEIMKLYQEMGVNPVAGCLPMVLQLPIWIGLYQAISKLAQGGILTEGWLFLPSLSCPGPDAVLCPTTHKGIGWVLDVANFSHNWPYLILPILTVITQIGVSRLMTPPSSNNNQQGDDPTQAMMKQMTLITPFMIGYFGLQFPSGLSVYWVTNNALTFLQYWVLNRENATPSLALAPVAATDGGRIVDVEVKPQNMEYPKESIDGKSRRKRKKR